MDAESIDGGCDEAARSFGNNSSRCGRALVHLILFLKPLIQPLV